MAFIRWKKLKHGTLKAYLVHSYRDEQGRPRHKTLAYLGDKSTLEPEHLEKLKTKHAHLEIKWNRIKAPPTPKRSDFSRMSDEELLQNLRSLRREYGIPWWRMPRLLEQAGAPRATSTKLSGWGMSIKRYIAIENALADGLAQEFYEAPVRDLAPAVRKVLSSA
jgi:hypothetical protein